jgi:DNA-binding transcriptional LysR family regulator
MINLELYRIFKIVADELNITKASEKLNISQPAVTKHIRNLENILGITLFKRNNKGLILTEVGLELYENLKNPIDEIIKIDNIFSKDKHINIGSHNHLLNVIFGECINEFYLEYPHINLNLKCLETNEMLEMLKTQELDIVFSKKVNDFTSKDITYFSLGLLNDVFIAQKNSNFANKIVSKKDLENTTIYVPRKYAQTSIRLINLLNSKNLNFKNSSYNTILELASKSESIGLITKEYVDSDKLEKYNLVELKTEFNLEPVEFGIYFNADKTKEVNYLIKIIKENFLK